jgi:hypothetical protein
MSDIPQRSRPFADRFVVDAVFTGAADDGGEWISALVEGKAGKFERTS